MWLADLSESMQPRNIHIKPVKVFCCGKILHMLTITAYTEYVCRQSLSYSNHSSKITSTLWFNRIKWIILNYWQRFKAVTTQVIISSLTASLSPAFQLLLSLPAFTLTVRSLTLFPSYSSCTDDKGTHLPVQWFCCRVWWILVAICALSLVLFRCLHTN